MTTTGTANITTIHAWSGPHGTGAHRTDIGLRTPATYREAQALADQLVKLQGYDPNGIVFGTR